MCRSETNATNVFMVKNNTVLTPHADYCLPGDIQWILMLFTIVFLCIYVCMPCPHILSYYGGDG